jgi:anti-anti-sigma regulatory factor
MMKNPLLSARGLEGGAAIGERPPAAGETAGPQARVARPARDFALALDWHGSGTSVLVLAGELDLYRASEVEAALAEAIGPEPGGDRWEPAFGESPGDSARSRGTDVRRLAVDLRSVTFIDSYTAVLLLDASRRQHRRGGELLVLVGPQTPMTVFEVTGFDRLLAIRRVDDDPKESAA